MMRHYLSLVCNRKITRSQAVARIADSTAKNCRGYLTQATPTFGENYLCASSAFPTQCCTTKFEVSSSSSFRDIALLAYWGHEFDLSRSRDGIGHVTIGLWMGHFLLVVLWNQASISNGFRDIQRLM